MHGYSGCSKEFSSVGRISSTVYLKVLQRCSGCITLDKQKLHVPNSSWLANTSVVMLDCAILRLQLDMSRLLVSIILMPLLLGYVASCKPGLLRSTLCLCIPMCSVAHHISMVLWLAPTPSTVMGCQSMQHAQHLYTLGHVSGAPVNSLIAVYRWRREANIRWLPSSLHEWETTTARLWAPSALPWWMWTRMYLRQASCATGKLTHPYVTVGASITTSRRLWLMPS